MRRRSVLLALGTALAGCSGRSGDGTDGTTAGKPTGTGDRTPTDATPRNGTTAGKPTPTGTATPTGTTTSPGSIPLSESPFVHEASVVRAEPTPERPPAIRVRVRNDGDRRHRLQTPNYAFPFPVSAGRRVDGEGSLVLSADPSGGGSGDPAGSREGGCWTGRPGQQPAFGGRTFAPGEAVSRAYAVLNPARDSPSTTPDGRCWTPGRYRFEQTYYLDRDESDDGRTYVWPVVLEVTDAPAVKVASF